MRNDRTTICRGDSTSIARAIVLLSSLLVLPAAAQPPSTPRDPVNFVLALDPRWLLAFDSPPVAPVGFDESAAYVPLKDGHIVAVDLESGERRWSVELETAFMPATGDGFVFAASAGEIVAMTDRTGTIVWRASIGVSPAAAPFWEAGTLFVSTEPGELLAIRAEDGTMLWRAALESPLAARPAVADDRLYVALADRRVVALDLETGTTFWTRPLVAPITGLLALEDQLIVGTRGNRLYSLKLRSGKDRWSWRVGADVAGAPVADDDHIYFVAFDNILRALSRRNGNLRWLQRLRTRPAGGPLLTGDVVIVPTVSSEIGAYRAKTGAQAFTIRAAGELGGAPFLREAPRPTSPRLISMSREGRLQGFASRHEPPPSRLGELPGVKVGR